MKKFEQVETPEKLIEDMCGDWEAPMEYKAEQLGDLQSHVSELHDNLPTSHLKSYLEELVEELGNKINYFSEI